MKKTKVAQNLRRFIGLTIQMSVALTAASTHSIFAQATETFTPANLLAGEHSYFRHLPVYDQGPEGTCYAYAVTQIVDYYRASHGEDLSNHKDLLSPLWSAYAYTDFSFDEKRNRHFNLIKPKPFNGGIIGQSFEALRKNICTRGQVEDLVTDFRKKFPNLGAHFSAEQFASAIESIWHSYNILYNYHLREQTALNRTQVFTLPRPTIDDIESLPSFSERPAVQSEVISNSTLNMTTISIWDRFKKIIQHTDKNSSQNNSNFRAFVIPNSLNEIISTNPEQGIQTLNAYAEKELYNFHKVDATAVAITSATEFRSIHQTANELSIDDIANFYRYFMGNSSRAEFAELIRLIIKKGTLYDLFAEILSPCNKHKKHAPYPDKGYLLYPSKNTERSKKIINRIFSSKNPQPIGIGYCADLLDDGKAHDNFSSCGMHSSVLVGQKLVQGKIHYLLQNSWGQGCVSGPWECLRDQGAYWIDSDILLKSTVDLNWLKI